MDDGMGLWVRDVDLSPPLKDKRQKVSGKN